MPDPLPNVVRDMLNDPAILRQIERLAVAGTPPYLRQVAWAQQKSLDLMVDHAMYQAARRVRKGMTHIPLIVFIGIHAKKTLRYWWTKYWRRKVAFELGVRTLTPTGVNGDEYPEDVGVTDAGQQTLLTHDLLDLLPPDDRALVSDWFGLTDGDVLSPDEVAAKYGYSTRRLAGRVESILRWLEIRSDMTVGREDEAAEPSPRPPPKRLDYRPRKTERRAGVTDPEKLAARKQRKLVRDRERSKRVYAAKKNNAAKDYP